MNGHGLEPVWPRRDNRLKPDLTLRARVGEDDRRVRCLDPFDHLRKQLGVEMAGPRKALHFLRNERLDHDLLRDDAAYQNTGVRHTERVTPEQCLARDIEVAKRCRQAPRAHRRADRAQPCQRELHLHAALRRHQLVPLVDDHTLQALEQRLLILATQQQLERLRRRDQRARQAFALRLAHLLGGVSGARFDCPRNAQRLDRCTQCLLGVGGQRAQRCDPQHLQRSVRIALLLRRRVAIRRAPRLQWADPGGVCLASAGRGMNQTRRAARIGAPHLPLKRERLPSILREPLLQRVGRMLGHSRPFVARNIARIVSSESASRGSLSVRQRLIRGKRTAIPLLWRVLS